MRARTHRPPYRRERGAVSLIGFQPQGKKGADGGVDGVEWFGPGKAHTAVVSVKGGRNLSVEMMRSLEAAARGRGAEVGILLTLEPPTKPMIDWGKRAGMLAIEGTTLAVPRLQVVTIEEALRRGEAAANLPMRHGDTIRKAPREAARPATEDLFG